MRLFHLALFGGLLPWWILPALALWAWFSLGGFSLLGVVSPCLGFLLWVWFARLPFFLLLPFPAFRLWVLMLSSFPAFVLRFGGCSFGWSVCFPLAVSLVARPGFPFGFSRAAFDLVLRSPSVALWLYILPVFGFSCFHR